MTSLTNLTVTDALARMAKKEFSAVELTEAHIAAMAKAKGMNAFITETPDLARQQAQASDARRAKGEVGALEGIPLAIKDLYCTKGARTTAASKILDNFVPTYESTVSAKLFEAAGRLGAILGEADAGVEEALAAYGAHVGTAFQLIDDVLDYSGQEAETGKHLGDDLAEGKPTLPLIHVIQHGTAEQADLVRGAIEQASGDRFAEVLVAVRTSGALDVARQHGEAEAALAKSSLAALPDSKFRETLLQLADFAVQRSF